MGLHPTRFADVCLCRPACGMGASAVLGLRGRAQGNLRQIERIGRGWPVELRRWAQVLATITADLRGGCGQMWQGKMGRIYANGPQIRGP